MNMETFTDSRIISQKDSEKEKTRQKQTDISYSGEKDATGPTEHRSQESYNYDVVANQISDEDAKAIADNSYAYYIFPKDQEELRDKVDEQLKELKKDGTLTELSQKYFGQDTAPEDDQFEKTPN